MAQYAAAAGGAEGGGPEKLSVIPFVL